MSIPEVVFVLGGPGAGKGTQCERIVSNFGFVHLSAGDLLREERASGSSDGELIESYIKDGKIVPVEITINLIKKAMDKSSTGKFLIDGFPRNKDNLDGWDKIMGGKVDLKFVLFFDCPDDICLERAMERGKSSGRSDDNPESFKKRINTYTNETRPIIEHFDKLSKVKKIDAIPGPDEVFEQVKKAFA
eukprot:Nk52_evm34s1569 gene=Nk52_evmTU34s1569